MGCVFNATPRPLYPGKDPVLIVSRLGGPQSQSEWMRKISTSPGFDPRTVHPVASRYTDWAFPAPQSDTKLHRNLIQSSRTDISVAGQAVLILGLPFFGMFFRCSFLHCIRVPDIATCKWRYRNTRVWYWSDGKDVPPPHSWPSCARQ